MEFKKHYNIFSLQLILFKMVSEILRTFRIEIKTQFDYDSFFILSFLGFILGTFILLALLKNEYKLTTTDIHLGQATRFLHSKLDFKKDYQQDLAKYLSFYQRVKIILSTKATRVRFLISNIISYFMIPFLISFFLQIFIFLSQKETLKR